jgi:hypothetical protein
MRLELNPPWEQEPDSRRAGITDGPEAAATVIIAGISGARRMNASHHVTHHLREMRPPSKTWWGHRVVHKKGEPSCCTCARAYVSIRCGDFKLWH